MKKYLFLTLAFIICLFIGIETNSAAKNESAATARVDYWSKYRCSLCGQTIYDPAEGDYRFGIPPRTPWAEVPDTYYCHYCYAPKYQFISLEEW